VTSVFQFFINWKISHDFLNWINNWNQIEMEITDEDFNFPIDDHKLSNFIKLFSLVYIIIPTLVYGGVLNSFSWRTGNIPWILLALICYFGGTLCMHSEDAQTIVVFKAIQMAFKYVNLLILNILNEYLIISKGISI